MFEKLIGDGALKNVVFVTTMWSSVDHALGLGREKELLENPAFFGAMREHGAGTARFDGTTEGAYNIIRSVSAKTTFPLNIQQEIIDKNLPLAETEAGKQVLASVAELQLQYKREISQLQSEMSDAIKQNDNSFAKALAEMSKEYEGKLASAQAQINALQSRNPEIEVLQIRHEQEMANLRDSLEDRMRFLEEQAGPPPPAYVEVGRTSDEGRESFLRFLILFLWTLSVSSVIFFRTFIKRLLRPRVPVGYRRLEWTCVCFESSS
jgi:hypothetical protein